MLFSRNLSNSYATVLMHIYLLKNSLEVDLSVDFLLKKLSCYLYTFIFSILPTIYFMSILMVLNNILLEISIVLFAVLHIKLNSFIAMVQTDCKSRGLHTVRTQIESNPKLTWVINRELHPLWFLLFSDLPLGTLFSRPSHIERVPTGGFADIPHVQC